MKFGGFTSQLCFAVHKRGITAKFFFSKIRHNLSLRFDACFFFLICADPQSNHVEQYEITVENQVVVEAVRFLGYL